MPPLIHTHGPPSNVQEGEPLVQNPSEQQAAEFAKLHANKRQEELDKAAAEEENKKKAAGLQY